MENGLEHMIRFGPAGIPIGTPGNGGTVEGIAYCRKIGLSAMEVEFVHGVKMKEESATLSRASSEKSSVSLSCHAPYYINCCAKEKAKLDGSVRHIVECAKAADWLSASPVVFHPGYYMGRAPVECKKIVEETLERCFSKMETLGIKGVKLGAELTGKKSAYGSLEEIIALSEHFGADRLIPVVDFAHYHARVKRLSSKADFAEILVKLEAVLGNAAVNGFHCHFSGIEFTDAGERNHLPIGSNSPPFPPLARALKERGFEGTVICESPLLEKDALVLQKEYARCK